MPPKEIILASPPSDAAIVITVNATVLRIIDGDTIHVRATIWPRQTWNGNIRLRGIDTPELRGPKLSKRSWPKRPLNLSCRHRCA